MSRPRMRHPPRPAAAAPTAPPRRPRIVGPPYLLAWCTALVLALGVGAPAASAANPPENLPLGALPSACAVEGAPECERWLVTRLDEAHAKLGLPSYVLPLDFLALSADKQLLILADLDRTAYGYAPIAGLNEALDGAAQTGVELEDDPRPPATETPWEGFGSDWADTGALRAYYLWMYDDGWESPNLDCTSPTAAGCWGHRHVILGEGLPLPQPEVLGVATGESRTGEDGTALIVSSHTDAATYYTWAQAQGEGAGGGEPKGEEGPKGGEAGKEGEGGKEEGPKGSGEGAKEESKGEAGEPAKPGLACRLVGSTRIWTADKRVAVISQRLDVPASEAEALDGSLRLAGRWQALLLMSATSSECVATQSGYELRGQGSATLGGLDVGVSFSFLISSSKASLSLEVDDETRPIFALSNAPIGRGSVERIWVSASGGVLGGAPSIKWARGRTRLQHTPPDRQSGRHLQSQAYGRRAGARLAR